MSSAPTKNEPCDTPIANGTHAPVVLDNKPPVKRGRKSHYPGITDKTVQKVFDLIVDGHTLPTALGAVKINKRTFLRWRKKNPDLMEEWLEAVGFRAEVRYEEIYDIARDEDISHKADRRIKVNLMDARRGGFIEPGVGIDSKDTYGENAKDVTPRVGDDADASIRMIEDLRAGR